MGVCQICGVFFMEFKRLFVCCKSCNMMLIWISVRGFEWKNFYNTIPDIYQNIGGCKYEV